MYKGIVLAGGEGTRLYPITKIINKHLLPIFNKPMIYYSLSILFLMKIKDILIICKSRDINNYKTLLGNGERFGVRINYDIQDKSNGIPEAFTIGKKFIGKSSVALILGDNFFYGANLSKKLINKKKKNKNCTIFLYPVQNPSAFGVVELNNKRKIKSIKEKPKKTLSNLAITGLYLFDNKVCNYVKKIKPSKRLELEITSLIKIYAKKKINLINIGRGSTWLDTGTTQNIFNATQFVKNIEERQGFKIGCLEEIAFLNKWISKKEIIKNFKFYSGGDYKKYLESLLNKNIK